MENATKAILIAGGVLIALIIISIGIYLYTLYSSQSEEYSQIISATELQKFNSKFDVYVGRNDITAQEIVSVVNLSKEYDNQVQIYLKNSKIEFTTSNTQEDFIKNNKDKKFSCMLNSSTTNPNPKYDEYGKIIKLTFTN